MNDYEEFKDRLEMAELLTQESETRLEVETYNDTIGGKTTVVYEFNDEQELVNIFVED